ncbi:hypothetical protein QQ045_002745 [Rhodiola kirilowii]
MKSDGRIDGESRSRNNRRCVRRGYLRRVHGSSEFRRRRRRFRVSNHVSVLGPSESCLRREEVRFSIVDITKVQILRCWISVWSFLEVQAEIVRVKEGPTGDNNDQRLSSGNMFVVQDEDAYPHEFLVKAEGDVLSMGHDGRALAMSLMMEGCKRN